MAKKNADILQKKISQLPERKANDSIWNDIEAKLQIEGLQRFIEDMEDKVAPEFIWDRLDASLANSSVLRKAIDELPDRTTLSDFSKGIVKSESFVVKNRSWLYSIAASFILLTVTWIFFNKMTREEKISFSEELVEVSPSINDFQLHVSENDEVLLFIESSCDAIAIKCESEEFQDLFMLYQELDKTYESLKFEAAENGREILLITYLLEVEKEKTEIGKQLIHMILS